MRASRSVSYVTGQRHRESAVAAGRGAGLRAQRAFDRPEEADHGDAQRCQAHQRPAVARGAPTGERAGHERDHRELAELHSDVEGDQRGQELPFGQAQLRQHTGEPEAVQQAEAEYDPDPPRPPAEDLFSTAT